MEQAQEPGHAATEGVEPDHPATGTDRPRRANRSLRVRMIGAVLIAGVATVAVGAFGINRMSALSAEADVVYTEGTVPVDALRKLQVDWWELQTHIARANIEALPAESRASSQEKAAAAGQTLAADVEAAADLPLSPDAEAAFGEFAGATQQYLALVAQIQQIVTDAQAKAAAAAAQLAAGPPLSAAAQRAVAEQQAAGQAQVLAAMQPLIAQMNELEVTIVDSATAATAAASAAAADAAAEARDAYEAARTLTLVAIAVGRRPLAGDRPARRPQRAAAGAAHARRPRPGGRRATSRSAPAPSAAARNWARWPRPSTRTLDALGNVLGLVNDSAGRLAGASTQLNGAADAHGAERPHRGHAGRRRRRLRRRGRLQRGHRGHRVRADGAGDPRDRAQRHRGRPRGRSGGRRSRRRRPRPSASSVTRRRRSPR